MWFTCWEMFSIQLGHWQNTKEVTESKKRKYKKEKRFRIRDEGGQWHIFSVVTEQIRKKLSNSVKNRISWGRRIPASVPQAIWRDAGQNCARGTDLAWRVGRHKETARSLFVSYTFCTADSSLTEPTVVSSVASRHSAVIRTVLRTHCPLRLIRSNRKHKTTLYRVCNPDRAL